MRFDWTILAGQHRPARAWRVEYVSGSSAGPLLRIDHRSAVCAGNLQTRRLMRLPSRVYVHVFRTVPENGPHLLDLPEPSADTRHVVLGVYQWHARDLAGGGSLSGRNFSRRASMPCPSGRSRRRMPWDWVHRTLVQGHPAPGPQNGSAGNRQLITELLKMTSLLAAITVGELAYQAYILDRRPSSTTNSSPRWPLPTSS